MSLRRAMMAGAGGVVPLKWSSTNKSASITLSNGDADAGNPTGTWQAVRGSTGHNTGMRQFEVVPQSIAEKVMPGCCSADFANYSDYIGSPTNTSGCGSLGVHLQAGASWYEHLESNVHSNAAHGMGGIAVGGVLTVGIDFNGDTIKFYKDGSLFLTRSGFTSLGSKVWYPAAAMFDNAVARIRGTGLAHPIAGYTDWDA